MWTLFDLLHICVMCCYLDVSIRLSETAQEKRRRNNNGLSHVPSKRKEIKSGTSGCGSFVVHYCQPATSIDRLQQHPGTPFEDHPKKSIKRPEKRNGSWSGGLLIILHKNAKGRMRKSDHKRGMVSHQTSLLSRILL